MLAYFPTLYEDELLYSWFARYHVHSANVSPKQTMKHLFGTNSAVAVPDLPTQLEQVYNRIRHFSIQSLDSLIWNHTLFLYYTAFQPKSLREKVYQAMVKGNEPGAIHTMTGIAASVVKEWTFFRFCPTCLQEDIQNKGEPYWHVSHQLPGVITCLKHGDYLCDSTVRFRNTEKHEFVAATEENCPRLCLQSSYTEKTKGFLKMIASQSQKLISSDFLFTFQDIQKAYRYLLIRKGFSNINGKVDQRKLVEQFQLFYGEELLSEVQSSVSYENPYCWLKNITRKHRKSFHPVRHILFIHFLGESVETFYKFASKEYQPFGEAPYYCLNPAVTHFNERVISDMRISLCTDTRRPVATFSCSCGFIYSRRGPDQVEEDQFKIGRIKQFGHVWESKLNQLVHIEKKSWYAAAKELQCDIGTVKKYTTELKSSDVTISKELTKEIAIAKQKEWLDLLQAHPEKSVTEIRKIAPALYAWHYRNNREWLKNHSPRQETKAVISNRVDWKERDKEILHQVKQVISKLYAIGIPVYVNKSRVGKEIGQLSLIEKHLDKLPMTKKYIEEHIESREQFQIRRIKWACRALAVKGEEIMEWKVRRLAGIRDDVEEQVKIALEKEILNYKVGDQDTENKTMAF
ncbi:TnsD family transposase [Cytobacillus kochii]|uniref:TnsD family transposase n=1 Tax=Cytobacillus kochii TaxID=859143 RepID=UPI00203C58A6|nr:TnsD family transposase [Cytobacillus kochii]MCM3325009.1 TnsD family transposase [Cytobacillus kochii]MCM3347400.1 TnsD family transposase [Cytobacillus kochii]